MISPSDQEFYKTYLDTRELLRRNGWVEFKSKRDKKILLTTLKKNGYSIFLLYGCDEDVKNEIL
jgi:hypothetical protein